MLRHHSGKHTLSFHRFQKRRSQSTGDLIHHGAFSEARLAIVSPWLSGYACKPSIPEGQQETEEFETIRLHRKLQGSLGYKKPCLKSRKKERIKKPADNTWNHRKKTFPENPKRILPPPKTPIYNSFKGKK